MRGEKKIFNHPLLSVSQSLLLTRLFDYKRKLNDIDIPPFASHPQWTKTGASP